MDHGQRRTFEAIRPSWDASHGRAHPAGLRSGYQTPTEGLEHSNRTGYKVEVHEIAPGVVYKDANVTVSAFNSHHGSLRAYGYRFVTPDRSIVISGDATAKGDASENCHQCDVLIHEVYTLNSFEKVSPEWKQYREAFHTSSKELAEIAKKSKPGLRSFIIWRIRVAIRHAHRSAARRAARSS